MAYLYYYFKAQYNCNHFSVSLQQHKKRGLSKDRCFILLFAVFWYLAQDAVISSQICIFRPTLLILLLRSHEMRPAPLCCLIATSDWRLQLQRTDGCLSSEPLTNAFTQLQLFFVCVLSFTSPARSRLEVSALAGIAKTFADEFFGVESSTPALLPVQYQIQQTVCFLS